MTQTILVNFHCHSNFSDGALMPEALAENLANGGVRFAALTDHDSIEGLPRFQVAAKAHGIACIPGVELTTVFQGKELHLLGYGFDIDHPELIATLTALRQHREIEVTGTFRKSGAETPPVCSLGTDGTLETTAAIALIHRAGGRAFWAHPLTFGTDFAVLDLCTQTLSDAGLDGLEAIYASYSSEDQEKLKNLAQRHDLLVCAGTDFHANANGPGSPQTAIAMPRGDWTLFRQTLFSRQKHSSDASAVDTPTVWTTPIVTPENNARFKKRSFILRIFFPTFIAIALFMAAIWIIILPSFERILLERKRDMIRELTNSAWSILASYERDERAGILNREQAQNLAITRIEALHYGRDGKDYFWIQDQAPRMIMHPYRKDLNGQDLKNFKDPRGVPIFVEFTQVVRRDKEGYIDYVWQWKDDPQRLESKESFVKGFEPWGWIIGTGIYIDDVKTEIANLERSLINTALIVSCLVILLLLFVLQQSLRVEKERQNVVDSLRNSTERYHSLVEATTEGTLLVLGERCHYANPTFLEMLGYTDHQLEYLDLPDLLPSDSSNAALWTRFRHLSSNPSGAEGEAVQGCLRHADGHLVECILTLNPMSYAGQPGCILLAKDVARQASVAPDTGLGQAAQSISLGIFRARPARRAVFVDLNVAAKNLIATLPTQEITQAALADLFPVPAEYDAFFQALMQDGSITDHVIHIESKESAPRTLLLSAVLVKDERQQAMAIDGVLQDITQLKKQENQRDALIDKLQSSLLFLHEPISTLGRDIVVCDMHASIEHVAHVMTLRAVTAALVATEKGDIIGIVTDRDLRARVLAEKTPFNAPVHSVMSSPLAKIPEKALMYEALMRMEEKGVQHLAIEDASGQIVSVIDHKSLIQFHRYGPIVVSREIARAQTAAEIARSCERVPSLVKTLLDSSARPRPVTNMLATTCDDATGRLIDLAIAELGPAPSTFAFIAMGSQGRQEQTLATDQDNGIIYTPVSESQAQAASDYFLKLGKYVCDGLNLAGYPYCKGQVMAMNPRWCRSLPDWLATLDQWLSKSEPQEIIDLNVFFDLRTVSGEAELTRTLRRAIHTSLSNHPSFYHHFAHSALAFKPPFRLLGNFYLSGGATEHAGEINLKDAMMPMVTFARLYALKHGLTATNTLERLEAMCTKSLILPASRDEFVVAYDFLMQLRLQNQLTAIQSGRPPLNIIHPGRLGYTQQELLKQAFAQIAAVQKKIGYDFLGGTT